MIGGIVTLAIVGFAVVSQGAPIGDPGTAQPEAVQPRVVPATAAPRGPEVVVEDPNDPVYLIGKELRCTSCQGMSIADSPADLAQAMMARVRALHGEGKSRQEILDYFVKSQGEWVLMRPKTEGVALLVWVLPLLALGVGAWLVARNLGEPSVSQGAASGSTDRRNQDEPSGMAPDVDYLQEVRNAARDME